MRTPTWTTLALAALVGGCGESDEPAERVARTAAEASSAAGESPLETETGEATYYADVLERQRTASGEPLDQEALVAAHRRFPFGTVLRVTNVENQQSVRVRVIDRGPFGAPRDGVERVIDLSRRAARQLGFLEEGSAPVRVEVLEYGEGLESSP